MALTKVVSGASYFDRFQKKDVDARHKAGHDGVLLESQMLSPVRLERSPS
jgi:hypothetical protein